MKKTTILNLGALALITTLPLVNNIPAQANFAQPGTLISQNVQRPDVKLNLTLAKQTVTKDAQGREIVSWQVINNTAVKPGDLLRYTVTGQNQGQAEAKNLMVTQPVPRGTVYVLKTADSANGAQITYSIDNGKSFVEKPMVEVKLPNGQVEMQPAPASAYTHVRWKFTNSIPANSTIKANYQVRVL